MSDQRQRVHHTPSVLPIKGIRVFSPSTEMVVPHLAPICPSSNLL